VEINKKNILVAIMAIVAVFILVAGFSFLKGTLFSSADPIYSALFSNVENLKKSDKVYLNGVAIGNVTKIDFEHIENPNAIQVFFTVNSKLKVPVNSSVEIIGTSLMGNKGLKLMIGDDKKIATDKDKLIGIDEKSMLASIGKSIDPLANETSILMKNANTLFDRNQSANLYITISELNGMLANLKTTLGSVNQMVEANQKPINQSMQNFEKISNSIAKKQSEISQIIENANAVSGQLKNADITKTMNQLNASMTQLNTLLADLNSGKGTAGKMLKDEEMYKQLNTTIESANSLLQDMQKNPKRYVHFSVFGGKK
jgi:phospholipid/cholesterol/gamma-HCH transport system substrate-binding protein